MIGLENIIDENRNIDSVALEDEVDSLLTDIRESGINNERADDLEQLRLLVLAIDDNDGNKKDIYNKLYSVYC